MGFNYNQYEEVLEDNSQDDYSNAGGCAVKHPFNKVRRAECNRLFAEKKKNKSGNGEADVLMSQAILELAKTPAQQMNQQSGSGLSGLAIGGIVLGSALMLVIMVIVIKKVKKVKK